MKSFTDHLVAEITRISSKEGLEKSNAFLLWFAKIFLDMTDDEAREAISIEGANDKGIDLIYIDQENGRILICQGKFSANCSYKAREKDVSVLQNSLNWLASPEALKREGRADLAEIAEEYNDAVNNSFGVELWYIYTGEKSANVDKHISVYNLNPDNIQNRRVIRHFHLDLLKSEWEDTQGTPSRIPHDKISLREKPVEFTGSFGKALIANVPAIELERLYKKYDNKLFDRNVRLWLGARKGSVNYFISETLAKTDQHGFFWAYNNGVTVICDNATYRNGEIKLKNFSVVNGCQTTVSIANSSEPINDVFVLVRFIAASAEIVDNIITYNNSQNPIRPWDIASQNRTQKRLKEEFALLPKPFIYLTRKGDKPKGDLRRYRDSSRLRIIRIDLLGQYAAAFLGDPVLAYKHKAFIFSKHHDDTFPPDIKATTALLQWTCGEICRDVVRHAMSTKESDEARILRKGGTLFVLATMSNILLMRNGATYAKQIAVESLTSKGGTTKLKKYAIYARDNYIEAVQDQMQIDNQELPTLIRQRDFYVRVRDRVARKYKKDAMAKKWLDEALPKV